MEMRISKATRKNILNILDNDDDDELSNISIGNKNLRINNNNSYILTGIIQGTNLKTLNNELKQDIIELKQEVKKLKNIEEKLNKDNEELQNLVNEKDNIINNQEFQIKELIDEINNKNKLIEDANKNIKDGKTLCKESKQMIKNIDTIIKDLNQKIKSKDEIIEDLNKKIDSNTQNINQQKQEIIKLMKELKLKDKEMKEFKERLPFELLPNEKIMTVIFNSGDNLIHYSIICKNTDIFTDVEKLLYQKYPDYKENENIFLTGGQKINRFKTLEENKINNSDIIILYPFDNELE